MTNFEAFIAKSRFSSFSTYWNFCPHVIRHALFYHTTAISAIENIYKPLGWKMPFVQISKIVHLFSNLQWRELKSLQVFPSLYHTKSDLILIEVLMLIEASALNKGCRLSHSNQWHGSVVRLSMFFIGPRSDHSLRMSVT